MDIKYNEEEIKYYLQKGYSAKLISMEFELPEELVLKCEQDLAKIKKMSNQKNEGKKEDGILKTSNNTKSHKNDTNVLRMEILKKNYNRIYNVNNDVPVQINMDNDDNSPKNIRINKQIKEMLDHGKDFGSYDMSQRATDIDTASKLFKNENLNINQMRDIINAMLNLQDMLGTEKLEYYWKKQIMIFVQSLSKKIDQIQHYTNDYDELITLQKYLTHDITKINPIFAESVKRRIDIKISKIRLNNIMDKRNTISISNNMKLIVEGISKGVLDVDLAKMDISIEAERRSMTQTISTYGLNKQQYEQKIRYELQQFFLSDENKNTINDPLGTIKLFWQVMDTTEDQAIEIVSQKLISQKKYDIVKKICDYCNKKEYTLTEGKIRRDLDNAVIADNILKAIKSSGNNLSANEEYCITLENGLKRGNIKLSDINLGKNKYGTHNITLADIWYERVQETNKTMINLE